MRKDERNREAERSVSDREFTRLILQEKINLPDLYRLLNVHQPRK